MSQCFFFLFRPWFLFHVKTRVTFGHYFLDFIKQKLGPRYKFFFFFFYLVKDHLRVSPGLPVIHK